MNSWIYQLHVRNIKGTYPHVDEPPSVTVSTNLRDHGMPKQALHLSLPKVPYVQL